MREVELKSAVPDPAALESALTRAGAQLTYRGALEDRRYDTPERSLAARDHVLRLRVYREGSRRRAMLDFKGPTSYEQGYKIREEHSTTIGDPDSLALMLDHLGYVVTREIDREITQYTVHGATVRIEHYPRMDVLVEVEGEPADIERAIEATGLPRAGFTSERLPDFIKRFETRTGERAAICTRELTGEYRYSAADA